MQGCSGSKIALSLFLLAVFLSSGAPRISAQVPSRTETRPDPSTAVEPAASSPNLTLIRSGNGQGKVVATPPGPAFRKGASVTLTAIPAPFSVFYGWSGACSGPSRTCIITLTGDRTVTAIFSLNNYTIHVRPPVNGVIHPHGTVKAAHGERRKFQIIPLPGYRVSEVLVDKVSQGAVNAYTFKEVTRDHVLEAVFVKQ